MPDHINWDQDIPLPEGPDDGDPYGEEITHEPPHAERMKGGSEPGRPMLLPSPNDPFAVAEYLSPLLWQQDNQRVLRHWRGEFWMWRGHRWETLEDSAIDLALYRRFSNAFYINKDGENIPWAPNPKRLNDVRHAMKALLHLKASVDAPAWADGRQNGNVIAFHNGLLDINTRTLGEHTPRYFNHTALPYDYDPNAPEPVEWIRFLGTVWPGDPDAIRLLQEWFGYLLTSRTDQQKMLLLTGPPRSGKGTIMRVCSALNGDENAAAPPLKNFATQFGLAPLIGKSIAIIGDARLDRRDNQPVVERLLMISGEDKIDVDRKHREAWTGRLTTRIMVASNGVPGFFDASTALANRFLILPFKESFLGREDITLESRLLAELPGILRWALDGLDDLNKTGRFVEPASSAESKLEMIDSSSPITAFVRERCVRAVDAVTPTDDLWEAWKAWCEDNGEHPRQKNTFGGLLTDMGFRRSQQRVNGKRPRVYLGIKLAPPEEDAQEDAQEEPEVSRARTVTGRCCEGGEAQNRCEACTLFDVSRARHGGVTGSVTGSQQHRNAA